MPLKLTTHECKVLAVIVLLLALGLLGMAVLHPGAEIERHPNPPSAQAGPQ